MNDLINKRVQVGQRIAKHNNEDLLHGLYVYKEYIFASMMGTIQKNEDNAFFVANQFPVKCIDIRIGDVVYGQISKIREEEAFVNLIQINEVSLSKNIEGTIRKEHVREKLVDQVIMMESFRPNDIIKAKVISLGDSSRNLYLTTAGADLGVLVAKNETSNEIMLPFDWTSMIDIKNGFQEKRKVAKPEL